jgi:hypothetical protein
MTPGNVLYSPNDSTVGRGSDSDSHRLCRRSFRLRLLAGLDDLLDEGLLEGGLAHVRAGRSRGSVVVSVPRAGHTVLVLCHQPQRQAAALAHFEPAVAEQMDWGNGDTSTWPTFSLLHCKPTSQSATTASVYCTFSESQAPAVGNPDSFWTVDLQRQSDGRWLISNYGQG